MTRVSHVHLGIRVAADPNGYVDPASLLPARLPVTAPEPEVVAAPEPASALPAVAEPVPPAVSESAVATVPTEIIEAGPAPSSAGRGQAGGSPSASRRSETPRVSAASDRAPEHDREPRGRRRPAAVLRWLVPWLFGRPRCATPSRRRRAPMPLPNRARRRQQRLRRRRSPIGSHAHSTACRAPAEPARCDQARPGVGAGERYGRRRSSPVDVAPARRGGGRGWAHGRGRQEGCTYH